MPRFSKLSAPLPRQPTLPLYEYERIQKLRKALIDKWLHGTRIGTKASQNLLAAALGIEDIQGNIAREQPGACFWHVLSQWVSDMVRDPETTDVQSYVSLRARECNLRNQERQRSRSRPPLLFLTSHDVRCDCR